MEDGHKQEDPMGTFRRALSLLKPDEEGKVHKDRLKEYFQKTLGELFEQDLTSAVLDHMKADDNGMISIDGFMEAFSTEYWTPESLTAMHDVLENAPHLVRTMVDWKNVLANLGVELTDDEMGQLITSARKCAADLLSAQLQKNTADGQIESGERSTNILQAVQDQLHLLDVGAAVKTPNKENQPEGQ